MDDVMANRVLGLLTLVCEGLSLRCGHSEPACRTVEYNITVCVLQLRKVIGLL